MSIRDAVSVIFAHGNEIFMIKRQEYLKAFPGYHAFPGGKVDRDEANTPLAHPLFQNHEPERMHALCREVDEELAFDLKAAVTNGDVLGLSELCTVTTPAFHRHRFRTSFYKVTLKEKPKFQVDEAEAFESDWYSPAALMAQFRDGRLLVVPPVRMMLEGLAEDITRTFIPNADFQYDPATEVPGYEVLGGLWQYLVPSDTFPPANTTNAFIFGHILMDPSPSSEQELEKLINSIAQFPIKEVFISHSHPDHSAYANVLAQRLNVPISCSQDTAQRIKNREPQFFEGLELKHYNDGDVLTQWNGTEVIAIAVPGHDEGQLAPMPRTGQWCLVSDLFQGVGTVVIARPEGHMGRYFATLEKVIALAPKVVIPSHGMASGGTRRLEETLAHRKKREAAIFELAQKGIAHNEMLKEIYGELHPVLRPLAMENIRGHIQKLQEDGKLARA